MICQKANENNGKPKGSLFLSLTDWWFPAGVLVAQGSAPLVLEVVLKAAADYLRLEPVVLSAPPEGLELDLLHSGLDLRGSQSEASRGVM